MVAQKEPRRGIRRQEGEKRQKACLRSRTETEVPPVIGQSGQSRLEFLIYEYTETANSFKYLGANLIVVYRETEMLLERRDNTNYGHRIEFRKVPEQPRRSRKNTTTLAKLQRIPQDIFDFFECRHGYDLRTYALMVRSSSCQGIE
jgi:hypothetical protein